MTIRIWSAAMAASLLLPCGAAMADVVTFQAGDGGSHSSSEDTFLQQHVPDTNRETYEYLQFDLDGATTQKGLVRFVDFVGVNAGQVPPGSTVNSCTLSLLFTAPSASAHSAHAIATSWDVSAVTWNNFGSTPGGASGVDYDAAALDSFTPATNGLYAVDITAACQVWVDGGANHGVMILNSSSDGSQCRSDNAPTPSERPLLTVDYTAPPDPGPPTACTHPQGGVEIPLFGDINESGAVNVADALCCIVATNAIQAGGDLGSVPCVGPLQVTADATCDGTVNIADVMTTVRLALGLSVGSGLLPGADGCPAACEDCTAGGGSCLIASVCVPQGARIGSDGCQVCDPALDPAGWTAETPSTYYLDDDDDTYGVDGMTSLACAPIDPYTATVGGDCDDGDGAIHPGATEVCDGIDNNCASGIDEGCGPVAGNCTEVLEHDPGAPSAVYTIDPDGEGGNAPYPVYCNMTLADGGWTLALNLDTSDGHVMWWDNDLWTDGNTYGDVATPLDGDLVSEAWSDMDGATEILLVVHEQGVVRGWKRFVKADGSTMLSHLSGGDNVLIGAAVIDSDTAGINPIEKLARESTTLFANHCVNGTCVTPSGGADAARIGSHQARPGNNVGGGLGDWTDITHCCLGGGYGGTTCTGGGLRTTSEAQAGWGACHGGSGMFGSDSFGTPTDVCTDAACGNANWSSPNGIDYDYSLYLSHRTVRASCVEYFEAGQTASAVYSIDPDGVGGNDPIDVYCDMETQGGGWTLAAYHHTTVPDYLFGTYHETLGDSVVPVIGQRRAVDLDARGLAYTQMLYHNDDPSWTHASRSYNGYWIGDNAASVYALKSNSCQLLRRTSTAQWNGELVYYSGNGGNDSGCSGGGSIFGSHSCDDGGGGVTTNNNWPQSSSNDGLWGWNCVVWAYGNQPTTSAAGYKFSQLEPSGLHAFYVRERPPVWGASCKDILDSGLSLGNGRYTIDPDGPGGVDPVEVYCDMTTAGGGWTRVASYHAEIPVCNLTLALGSAGQVSGATASASTAWLPASTVSLIPWNQEVLAVFGTGTFFAYRSTNPAFTWSAIAGNAVRTDNVEPYGVQGSDDGSNYFTMFDHTSSCINVGACLMGGRRTVAGLWTAILGIGGWSGGSPTAQSPTCGNLSYKGFFNGSAWNVPGTLLVR